MKGSTTSGSRVPAGLKMFSKVNETSNGQALSLLEVKIVKGILRI